jgi:hypothetical protein
MTLRTPNPFITLNFRVHLDYILKLQKSVTQRKP